jgi:hypothetical protein
VERRRSVFAQAAPTSPNFTFATQRRRCILTESTKNSPELHRCTPVASGEILMRSIIAAAIIASFAWVSFGKADDAA